MNKVIPILSVLLAVLIQWPGMSQGERILVLFPTSSKSHMIAFRPVLDALALKGHQVTIVSPFTSRESVKNIREIKVKGAWNDLDVDWFKMSDRSPLVALTSVVSDFRQISVTAYKALKEVEEFQRIIRTRDVDLVIVSAVLNDFVLPIVDHLKVPWIYFCPPSIFPFQFAAMGMDQNYASIPSGLGDYDRRTLTFKNRIVNSIGTELFLLSRQIGLLWMLDDMAKEDFPDARPIAEIEKDAELSIINHHPATAWPRPFPPTVIPIGPLHTRPANPLPEDLQVLADKAKEGFIVFTLGSAIPVSSMPPHIFDMFVQVFARIPQLVFWKWEKKDDPMKAKLPSNVKTLDWLPQQDLLGHGNARLFITHGGLVGIQEAVYHGVPLLGLPFGNDQRGNLAKAGEEGFAIKLAWKELSEPLLYGTIQSLLHQPSFKGNATRLSRLLRDELVPSKDLAVYWVEHVLRHKGTKHLQSTAKQMPFYQLYLIDVWIFLFTTIFGVSALFWVLLCKLACPSKRKVKTT